MATNGHEEIPYRLDEQRVRDELERARSFLSDADRQVRSLAQEKPLWVLGGALVAGYLVGRLMGRS